LENNEFNSSETAGFMVAYHYAKHFGNLHDFASRLLDPS